MIITSGKPWIEVKQQTSIFYSAPDIPNLVWDSRNPTAQATPNYANYVIKVPFGTICSIHKPNDATCMQKQ